MAYYDEENDYTPEGWYKQDHDSVIGYTRDEEVIGNESYYDPKTGEYLGSDM